MPDSLIQRSVVTFTLLALALGSAAQNVGDTDDREVLQRDLVRYPASFFERFQPVTALDMVRQVPGFRLEDDSGDIRGFASAAGNVLIDDRRPSTKRDTLEDILTRIPASTVRRIELIRAQVRNIDLRGQSEVVNLVLREGIPAVVRWDLAARKTFGFGPVVPEGSMSLADAWQGIDVNVGISARRNSIGRQGTENIFDPEGNLLEARVNERNNRNKFLTVNLNASSWWGETFWQVNTTVDYEDRLTVTDSRRLDVVEDIPASAFFRDVEEQPLIELGIDLEREVAPGLLAKGIFLGSGAEKDIVTTQTDFDADNEQTLFREAVSSLDSDEIITRVEFDLTRYERHLVQLNVERAYNALDGTLVQTDDTGDGPVVIDIPGADSRIEETRWDLLVDDTWVLGDYELNYGLGAEASTIRQTGDAALERDFFFVKPQFVLTHSAAGSDLMRLRVAREVAQLNLEDFVSATEFLDDDLALGNPNIEPDTTWKLELTRERRLGTEGVIKITAFHHWISDVLDLLPLTPTFEAPGNIGDGRRWGLTWESTLPLGWLGLDNAKLDSKIRWQDSSVTDPVTGKDRVLSVTRLSAGPVTFDVENEYAVFLDYRQDFRASQVAWGFSVWERGEQPRFLVNEFQVYDEGAEFRAFVETTRWGDLKFRIDAENILDFADTRERWLYVGERGLSPLDERYFRDRTRGRRLQLTVSGTF